MVLAVNMPEQLPQVGQAAFSISSSSSAEILPFAFCTPADEGVDQVDRLAAGRLARLHRPAGDEHGRDIDPHRAHEHARARSCRSWGCRPSPSKQCAWTIVSTQSAISSREGSEYFIPAWPIAMPSSTPMVLNTNGTPPAARTHSLRNCPRPEGGRGPG